MALQVYSAAPRSSMIQTCAPQGIVSKQASMVCVAGDYPQLKRRKERGLAMSVREKASLDATAAAEVEPVAELVAEPVAAEVGKVTEVNVGDFWPIVKAAGDKAVVLDMYTQWCGPCKLMAPKYKQLSEKYTDVVFLKLDCNHENRPLAKELGLKVVPTFKIFKDSKVVKEVTGAKFDDLVHAIETARSS